MPKLKTILILTIFSIFSFPVFAEESKAALPLPDFDLDLAYRLLHEENALLLDIRTEDEFQLDHIEGATFIPFLNFSQYLQRIEELTNGDKNRPIVLYCRTGRRAGIVKQVLLQEGYTQVTNMGGLGDWQSRFNK